MKSETERLQIAEIFTDIRKKTKGSWEKMKRKEYEEEEKTHNIGKL